MDNGSPKKQKAKQGANPLLVAARFVIPYIKELKQLQGVSSTHACLVMAQLEYWMSIYPEKTFYKFAAPPQTEQYLYKEGQSWIEELDISKDEFVSAFDQIGVRYRSTTEYKAAKANGDVFQGKYYCCYFNKVTRLTHYFRNDKKVEQAISFIRKLKTVTPRNGDVDTPESDNSDSRDEKSANLEQEKCNPESSYTSSDNKTKSSSERGQDEPLPEERFLSGNEIEEETIALDNDESVGVEISNERILIPEDFSPTWDEEYRAMLDFPEISPSWVTAKFVEHYKGSSSKFTYRAWHHKWWDWVGSERSTAKEEELETEHSDIRNKVFWQVHAATAEMELRLFTADDICEHLRGIYSEHTISNVAELLVYNDCFGRVGEYHYFNCEEARASSQWWRDVTTDIRVLGLEEENIYVKSRKDGGKSLRQIEASVGKEAQEVEKV